MVCPLEMSKRAQHNADGGLGLGREVAVHQFIRLQFPDQIEFEGVEENLDLALPAFLTHGFTQGGYLGPSPPLSG